MVHKCILFSSFCRASSHWRLKVLSRELDVGVQVIWLVWSEVQVEEARLNSCVKRKNTTSSLHSENARRAIENGQHGKAISFFPSSY